MQKSLSNILEEMRLRSQSEFEKGEYFERLIKVFLENDKGAFIAANLPSFAPHSFRKTLVRWADRYYSTREAFKAFSQNIGHGSALTTISSYMPVSQERQAELIRA